MPKSSYNYPKLRRSYKRSAQVKKVTAFLLMNERNKAIVLFLFNLTWTEWASLRFLSRALKCESDAASGSQGLCEVGRQILGTPASWGSRLLGPPPLKCGQGLWLRTRRMWHRWQDVCDRVYVTVLYTIVTSVLLVTPCLAGIEETSGPVGEAHEPRSWGCSPRDTEARPSVRQPTRS